MSWQAEDTRLSVLAVIPARGGSKGIPGKNLKLIGGLSLVGRAARLAASQSWVDQVIVSTDDAGIASEAVRQGAEAPFMRPSELSGDAASSDDMWRHAWESAEEHYGRRFDVSLLLEPTSPLRQPADLTATMDALLSGSHAAAATVSATPAHFSPHKTLTVGGDGRIGFWAEDGSRYNRRQNVPALYHRNGLCYALRREPFLEGAPILGQDCAAVVIERPVVNIDEPFDLELAEWLLARQQRATPDMPLAQIA
ncbi:MAG: acylneuraminate cytidylyltransferase family protein [Alphaproteobacteria bacterium]|nr:acylneuraminate cytidylyltransferase family protein [Alphaproteobacteria bacterium]